MIEGDDDEPQRDPDSLAERIRHHPDVTNFVPVEGAAVPILTFDWEGINIDLLFARLSTPSVPPNFDIDSDMVLSGVDSATEKSLNGPRVTNLSEIACIVLMLFRKFDHDQKYLLHFISFSLNSCCFGKRDRAEISKLLDSSSSC